MSHYTRITTRIVEPEYLMKALDDLGYPAPEVHAEPAPLIGWFGRQDDLGAHVILRAGTGRNHYDVGFRRDQAGNYQAIVVAEDAHALGYDFIDRLNQRYAYHATRHRLEEQGFALVEETTESDGRVRLLLRRMA